MTNNVITLRPNDSIAEAAKIFDAQGIHHIPVVEEGNLVGMVSKTDYLFFKRGFLDDKTDQRIEEIRMNNYELSDIMTRDLQYIRANSPIQKALELFQKNEFHALPVLDEGQLVGLVTTFDIIDNILTDQEVQPS
ncbi:MAG TPA: CBS domain-containing protein [Saprospiraceae bacterium]|nr:CBS domain-containing protein [Saprospiraceae bacterium]